MKVLGHFDRDDLERRFVAAGLYTAIEAKGFSALELHVHSAGMALPHIQLHGDRDGSTALLLDACLSEALVRPTFFHERGFAWDTAVELALVYWVREQDPSRAFTGARPPLPLQEHPGLGVLPMAFQVVRDMAVELGKDGVACTDCGPRGDRKVVGCILGRLVVPVLVDVIERRAAKVQRVRARREPDDGEVAARVCCRRCREVSSGGANR